MLGGRSVTDKFQQFGDGVVTSRNTFQKYFAQGELKEYIDSTLDVQSVAVGPGIFFVFKDTIEEQLFLSSRSKGQKAVANAHGPHAQTTHFP